MQGQQQKKRNQAKEKSARTQAIKPEILDLPSKTLSRYQTNILLRGLKFALTHKRNNIELKSFKQNYTRRLRLPQFYDSEGILFQKESTFTLP